MAVVSKEAAGTVSLREGILEVEGDSDFTAEPVAPSTDCVVCNCVACTELKPFLA